LQKEIAPIGKRGIMKTVIQIAKWLTTLLVPAVLALTAVRILLTPLFMNLEYRLPYFPDDPYGFTREERLYWSDLSRKYLVNSTGIEFLADLQFEDGSSFYNERELHHMFDVKNVIRAAMNVMAGGWIILVAIGIWAWRSKWWEAYKSALSRGGWLALGLIAMVLVYLALNFDSLFVTFHRIFFEGDSWLFKYSDSLIRLFPVVFWRDAFIWVGTLTLGGGLAIGYYFSRKR
jgi:integral membrane protein (TIGR01906 family)